MDVTVAVAAAVVVARNGRGAIQAHADTEAERVSVTCIRGISPWRGLPVIAVVGESSLATKGSIGAIRCGVRVGLDAVASGAAAGIDLCNISGQRHLSYHMD